THKKGYLTWGVEVAHEGIVSYFKGDVVARDMKAKRCFRVFQPRDAYQWIDPIKLISPRRIALINREDPRDVVYFDPVKLTLERDP
ncbi:hypothetical protein L6232_21285, partial [Shewanella sp. C31]|nr:hypothetical protein [Shewanella electrica]